MAAGQPDEELRNKYVTVKLSSSRSDGQLAITCKYDTALIAHIKALPNRAWKPDTREWLCPGNDASLVMSHFRDAGVRVFVQGAAPQTPGGNEISQGREQASGTELVIQLPQERRDGNIAVTFPFSQEMVDHMKLLPAELRSWHPQEKAWICPADALEEIKSHWRRLNVKIKIRGSNPTQLKAKERLVPMLCQEAVEERLSELPQEAWDKLFPYQREGVEFGVKRNAKVILADEMGLGKTVQAIMIAAAFREDWPLLIICPSTLRLDWESALHTWLPPPILRHVVTIMSGSDIKKKLAGPLRQDQITIASFDMAQKIGERVCKGHRFVICDESHSLKNHTANRTIFLRPILRAAAHTVLISGTPIQTRPIDMYTQIDAVRPGLLGSRDEYGQQFCGGSKVPIGNGFSDWRGASNVEELNQILQGTILVRRLKKDVLKDLPDKMRREVTIEISAKDQKALRELRGQLGGVEQDSSLNESQRRQAAQLLVNELYRATGRAKLPGSVEHLRRLLQTGHKVLAFAHHAVIMDGLEEAVRAEGAEHVRIDGHSSPLQKKAACDRFQTCGKVKAAILSITAAGTGITLTAASAVVFAELTWNPADLVQAEDRAHRVGQTKFLQVHYMVAAEPASADEMMWRNLRNKLNVVGRVIDGHAQGGAAGLDMNEYSLAASQLPAASAAPSIPATPQAARPPVARAPDHTPLKPGGAAAVSLAGKSRLVPSADRMRPVSLDKPLAGGTGVFATTQEAWGVGPTQEGQPVALDDSQDGGTGVFAAEPGPDVFGTQPSQAAWQAPPEDTPPPRARRLPTWMDDGPGHWSQTPQKRKASSPAEDTQATQWKLLRSSNTATENTQGSCDGVVDLTQPTQVYQSTLTMADCQPHQSSLQQPVATGVFTEDDDGDEVICVD